MFIKPTKKWRSPEGDTGIMVPYTYYRLCEAALEFYGKWLDEKREAQERQDRLAEEARRRAEEAKEARVSLRLKTLQPETACSVGAEHVCSQTIAKLGLKSSNTRRTGKCRHSSTRTERRTSGSSTWYAGVPACDVGTRASSPAMRGGLQP